MAEKLKTLLNDTIIYGLGSVVIRVLTIFFVPIYTRLLTPADYGVLDILSTVTSLLTVILVLGLDGAMAYYYYETADYDQRISIISTSFFFRLIFSLLTCSILFLYAHQLSWWFIGDDGYTLFFSIAIAGIPFQLLVSFYQGLFRVKRAAWKFVLLTISNTALIICFNIFLVIILRYGIIGILISNLFAGLILTIFGFVLCKQYLSFRFSNRHLKLLLNYGLPLIPASVSYWILSYVDRYFLISYSNLTEVGLYSIGNKLSGLLSFFTIAFQMAWPVFALSIQHAENARTVYAKVLLLYTVIMSFLVVGLSLFSKEILLVVTPRAYLEAYQVVGILGLSLMIMGIFNILGIGLALAEKTKHLGWITGLAAILNIICNFILIPDFGMIGAAVATFISFSFSNVILFIISQRYFPVPYEIKKITRTLVLALIIILSGLILDHRSDSFRLFEFIEKFSLLVSLIVLLWLFKVILTEEILAGWKFIKQGVVRFQ